jgi:excisionase family DNA binding protein
MRTKSSRPIQQFVDPSPTPRSYQIKPLWTLDVTATYLCLSVPAVRGLIFRRVLPHVKIGRNIRFKPADVERWLDENVRGAR